MDAQGITRIYRNYADAVRGAAGNSELFKEYPRKDAVGEIRARVFKRSDGHCRDCGKNITWNFHMHEDVPRGKGGEINIWNSVALCANCHLNFEHGERRLRFGEN